MLKIRQEAAKERWETMMLNIGQEAAEERHFSVSYFQGHCALVIRSTSPSLICTGKVPLRLLSSKVSKISLRKV